MRAELQKLLLQKMSVKQLKSYNNTLKLTGEVPKVESYNNAMIQINGKSVGYNVDVACILAVSKMLEEI